MRGFPELSGLKLGDNQIGASDRGKEFCRSATEQPAPPVVGLYTPHPPHSKATGYMRKKFV